MSEYSGNVHEEKIGYHKEEDVEVDDEKTVHRSRGTGYVALAPRSDSAQEEEEESENEGSTDNDVDIPPMEVEISYDLTLISCEENDDEQEGSGFKSKRSVLNLKSRSKRNTVTDTLLAKWDQGRLSNQGINITAFYKLIAIFVYMHGAWKYIFFSNICS